MSSTKLMNSRTLSGTFPNTLDMSPCGEEDGSGIEVPKGWSSERVPRSSYRSRKHVAAAALMPFSSGRTLPSKWEDAERWICSPISLGNVSTNNNSCYYGPGASAKTVSQLSRYQRRAKSKSGPLGPVGPGFYGGGYNSFSPVLGVGVINGGRWRNSLTIEPSGLGSARFEERLGVEGGGVSEGGRRSCPGHPPHWLDSWSGPPSPTQDEVNLLANEKNEGMNKNFEQDNCNGERRVNRVISRRDMATQMFPESQSSSPSAVSSPKSSISTTSQRPLFLNEPRRDVPTSEFEVRDVQVDKQTSVKRPNLNVSDVETQSNSSTSFEAGNKVSKFSREEAKINAWENLQKAKAESAIQKLEEKLEKKRASSMEKIIQKLRKAEIKAQKMRSSISSGSDQVQSRSLSETTSKIPSFCKKIRLSSSTRKCSPCYLF